MKNRKGFDEHPEDKTTKRVSKKDKTSTVNENWENFDSQLSGPSIDQLFQQQLEEMEIPPSPAQWSNIKKRLPSYPRLFVQFKYISRIAAALLIGTTMYIFSSYWSASEVMADKAISVPPPTFGEVITQNQDVEQSLTHQPEKNNKTTKNKSTKSSKSSKEAEELLASLLADDDFGDSLDLEHLETILQPLEPLPVFSAMASAAENEKILMESMSIQRVKNLPKLPTRDFTISVPLIVVEEHEIEHLLKIYERFERAKK